jgi:hypothetical protein
MHIPQLVNLKISIRITLFGDSKPLDGKASALGIPI